MALHCVKISLVVLIIMMIASCGTNPEPWQKVDLRSIPVPTVTIHRYEKALFSIDPSRMAQEIASLTDTFSVFLGGTPPDSAGILQLMDYVSDPFIRELHERTRTIFPDLAALEKQLSDAFRHYAYYFPGWPIPRVYTYISGIDYLNAVVLQDQSLLIALDMFLGADFEPYKQLGLPEYMVVRFQKGYLLGDCMQEMGASHLQGLYPGDNVLEKMIVEGKKLFFLDAMLPYEPDSIKIRFSEQQLQWCIDNESSLWKFIIENQILYATDIQVIQKFFNDGPFTRGFPGSPSRLGAWVGWQIVRQYMIRFPQVNLQELLENTDAQGILKDSGYKPEKK